MTDRLTRLFFVLATTIGTGLIGAAAVRMATLGPPSPTELTETCGRALAGGPSVAWLATLVLAALVALSIVRAGRVAVRLADARRRLRRLDGRERELFGRKVVVLSTRRTVAFCAGFLRPRIFLSTGAMERLDRRQMDAVLAHEQHHVKRWDPLRIALRRVASDALFFLPGHGQLALRLDELAEYEADDAAIRAVGGSVRPLAGALLAFEATEAPPGAGIGSARADRLSGMTANRGKPVGQPVLSVLGLGVLVTLTAVSASLGAATADALHTCLTSILVAAVLGSPVTALVASRHRKPAASR